MNKITRYTTPGCKHILPAPPYLSSSYSLKIPQIQMAKNYTSLFDREKIICSCTTIYFNYIYNQTTTYTTFYITLYITLLTLTKPFMFTL